MAARRWFRFFVRAMRRLPCLVAVVMSVCAAAPAVGAEKTAEQNYRKNCAGCHGSDGKAKTRLGRKSGAKDISDKAAMAKLTDAEVFKTIKEGRKDEHGEEKMEAFADDLSDQEITAIVAYVRTLAK